VSEAKRRNSYADNGLEYTDVTLSSMQDGGQLQGFQVAGGGRGTWPRAATLWKGAKGTGGPFSTQRRQRGRAGGTERAVVAGGAGLAWGTEMTLTFFKLSRDRLGSTDRLAHHFSVDGQFYLATSLIIYMQRGPTCTCVCIKNMPVQSICT
jgi:hypothetical protein